MINNVTLVGRLTRPVDLRYTPNGVAVGTFSLAVNRNFANQNGERETDFINCVIWRKSAETLANYTRKGTLIGVQGRIQTRSYDNQTGQRVYVTEVLVENFSFLESKGVTEQRPVETAGGYQNQTQQYAAPSYQAPQQDSSFASFNNQAENSFANGDIIDISDDDLPF